MSEISSVSDIPFQDASIDIWDKKYRLKKKNKEVVDETIFDTYKRVARALAHVEEPKKRGAMVKKFIWALENGAIPAGRIISNAGAEKFKPETSTINCTVSNTIFDSMNGILDGIHEAGRTLKAGCGIGYEFSTLRPKDSYVNGAGATTSGPLSFMDIYDKMCFTISSAGGRRGAQMATFDISHPDIFDFIKAKREDGRFRQFNFSCLITSEFMEAVKKDEDWPLSFPVSKSEMNELENGTEEFKVVYRDFPVKDEDKYIVRDDGLVACRVYKTVKALGLWNAIMSSTYDYAEPGFILIDEVNEMNNNWWIENVRATNPCGEQPLPPYGACLLGSVNLTKFVKNPFTPEAYFDWELYGKVVSIFTRMLDNVVEINGLPLEQQRHELEYKRRHGMGFLGLGSALTMLGVTYGSDESLEVTERIAYELARENYKTGLELAKEKGAAPIMNDSFVVTTEMLAKRPEMAVDGYKVGDKVKGKILWGKYSRFMQKFMNTGNEEDVRLMNNLVKYGCRFTHATSIAPTGTISLSLANNASNGIEPSFAHHYSRNVIREGKKTKEKVEVYSFELLAYRELVNPNAMPDATEDSCKLPDYFIIADTVTPKQHVDIQAAAQIWVDSSISKTANVPTDFAFEKFEDIYMYAYDKGLKGCTTFRFNPEAFSGVLVKESDLSNTEYTFTLDNGEEVTVKGNETIEYDGEMHTAANLFDALKEGYYGKF